MPTIHVVDTHALVWYLDADPRLGANAKAVLDDPTSDLVLPVIALAEACWIIERGKTNFAVPADFLKALDGDPRIKPVTLDRDIVERTLALTGIGEMHDRQIVATTLRLIDAGHSAVLLTKDTNITTSGLVPVLW